MSDQQESPGVEGRLRRGPAFLIRDLRVADCETISRAFAEQGWDKPVSQYRRYLEESASGARDVLVAELHGGFAGYLTIDWQSGYPSFRATRIPEIVDFNVLMRFRRRGIGSMLMDEAERRVAARSAVVGIGVGLTPDYGAAHILYVKRGYVPDGLGVCSAGTALKWGEIARVDDNLNIYLTKPLRQEGAPTSQPPAGSSILCHSLRRRAP
jgi:GNAT superfamily N-acetyltransferase